MESVNPHDTKEGVRCDCSSLSVWTGKGKVEEVETNGFHEECKGNKSLLGIVPLTSTIELFRTCQL